MLSTAILFLVMSEEQLNLVKLLFLVCMDVFTVFWLKHISNYELFMFKVN